MPQNVRPVIYALGRLLTRQYSPTPTGIDRLDLRYAHWLLSEKQRGRTVIFVRQVRNVMCRINDTMAETVIRELWQRWVENRPVPLMRIRRQAEGHLFWLINRLRNFTGAYIDPTITDALSLPASPGQRPPVYLNAAHIGAQFEAVHQLLRETTGAELFFYLHDIIPIDYPEYFSNLQGDVIHQGRVRVMARHSTTLLVNSAHTAQRFSDYCRQQELPTPQQAILKIGVEDHIIEAAAQPLQPLPQQIAEKLNGAPFFICVGTIEPRKNHLLLLHLWRSLSDAREACGKVCPKLVIIGRRGWENENIIDLLDRSHQIRKHVIELNGLSDPEMITLIRHARALLMPSFEEGWGIPLAEALTLKTPALCSDIPALRECGQNYPTYLDPLDGLGWRTAIEALTDTQHSGKNDYQPDRWEHHLQQLARVIGCNASEPIPAAIPAEALAEKAVVGKVIAEKVAAE